MVNMIHDSHSSIWFPISSLTWTQPWWCDSTKLPAYARCIISGGENTRWFLDGLSHTVFHMQGFMMYCTYLDRLVGASTHPSQLTHCCHLSNSRKIYFNHCDLCNFWFGSNTAFWVTPHFCCESSAVKLVLFLGTLWDGLMDWIGIKWRKCENHKHLPVATWGFILTWYSNCRVLPAFQWAKHMGPTSTRRKQNNVGYRYETEGAFDKPRHCIDIGANYNRM